MKDNQGIRYAAVSDLGLKRAKNEDAYMVEECDTDNCHTDCGGMLFVVADGMGGHSCGEVASTIACREMAGSLFGLKPKPAIYHRHLKTQFHQIDQHIRACASRDPACKHMGTTLSALAVSERFAIIAHVGDSRIYRLRGNRLKLLTTDHTFVQEMIDEGELSPESAATHPFRNMLTLVIGTQEPLERVYTCTLNLAPGDRFLLCSDGLHNAVAFKEIEKVLGDGNNPEDAARQLLSLALDRGGRDNITIIVAYLPALTVVSGKTSGKPNGNFSAGLLIG